MHVHPAISALRSDLASQRRSQEAMKTTQRDWLGSETVTQTRRELQRFAAGAQFDDLPSLYQLVSDHSAANAWVQQFYGVFMGTLRTHPLSEVPMRHGSSTGFARLQLLQSEGAVLSLCAYEPVESPVMPGTVQFADCEIHEIVISGTVHGYFHRLHEDCGGLTTIQSAQHDWSTGNRITRRAGLDARHFVDVQQSVVVLQLSRTPVRPRPSREFRLKDAALVQQVSGDKRASEQVMALGVLGALDDRRAIEPMKNFAQDISRDPDARWEAVRQVLAMDTAAGMALLSTTQANAGDPLARPSGELRQHLLASDPALRTLESELA